MNLTLPNNVSQRVFLKVLNLNLTILQFHQTGFKDKPTPILHYMLVFLKFIFLFKERIQFSSVTIGFNIIQLEA